MRSDVCAHKATYRHFTDDFVHASEQSSMEMGLEGLGYGPGLSGFGFFALSLTLFVAGALMTFTPKTKFG